MITIKHRIDFDTYRALAEFLKQPTEHTSFQAIRLISDATDRQLRLSDISLETIDIVVGATNDSVSFVAAEIDAAGSMTRATHTFVPGIPIVQELNPIRLVQLATMSSLMSIPKAEYTANEPNAALQCLARQLLGVPVYQVKQMWFDPHTMTVRLTVIDADSNVDDWCFVNPTHEYEGPTPARTAVTDCGDTIVV